MKISVCIPNYNYAQYIGRAIRSALVDDVDVEVVVADNASTDDSVEVVRGVGDPRVKVERNPCNVGFARNLDRAAGMASGEWLLMLSSDDIVKPGALDAYRKLIEALG